MWTPKSASLLSYRQFRGVANERQNLCVTVRDELVSRFAVIFHKGRLLHAQKSKAARRAAGEDTKGACNSRG